MSETRKKIEVMEAYDRGEAIESKYRDGGPWSPLAISTWNWAAKDYRVKPEPREIWINYYYRLGTCLTSCIFSTLETAEENAEYWPAPVETVHFREVRDE